MKTATKTNTLRHSIVEGNSNRIVDIRITLDDKCKNGHEDFSITANIRERDDRGIMRDAGGGCCHELILSLRPELKQFVDLHLSTWQGVPMHCAANAFYWLAGYLGLSYVEHHGSSGSDAKSKEDCLRIFRDHIRCTEDELPALLECRSVDELRVAFEDLGIVARWKNEADAAIKQLELWTGKEFESEATRGHWEPVTVATREMVAERRASGYYSTEAIAARDTKKAAAMKAEKRAELLNDHDKAVRKAEKKLEVELFVLDNFGTKVNCIYYEHSNELSLNWSSTCKLVTKEEFDNMVEVFKGFRTANLPEGVKLEWKEHPKY